MLVEQIAKHINRDGVQVNVPAYDRLTINISGRGSVGVMDMGYNSAQSHIFSFGFSLTEREKLGRVYLPLWYTPKMYAAYIDALIRCSIHRVDASKLDQMLDGYNPQETKSYALERLASMSYVEGYEVWFTNQRQMLWKEKGNETANIIEITPVDDYFLRVSMMDAYGGRISNGWRTDYAYDLDDIVAYMTVCRMVLEQHQHIAVTT